MATLKDYRVSVINTRSNIVERSETVKASSKAAAAAPFFTALAMQYLDANRRTLKGVSISYLETIAEERMGYRIKVDIVGQVTCAALNKEQGEKCLQVAKAVRRRRRRHHKSTVTTKQFTAGGEILDMSVRTSKQSA